MKPAVLDPYLFLAVEALSDFSFFDDFSCRPQQRHGLLLARQRLFLPSAASWWQASFSDPVDCTTFMCACVDNDGPEIYFQIILITIIRFGSSVWVKRDSRKSFPAVSFFFLLLFVKRLHELATFWGEQKKKKGLTTYSYT